MVNFRNSDLWNEIFDLPVFTITETSKHTEAAWRWAEALADGGKLRAIDLISLEALLPACIAYGEAVGEAKQSE